MQQRKQVVVREEVARTQENMADATASRQRPVYTIARDARELHVVQN